MKLLEESALIKDKKNNETLFCIDTVNILYYNK